MRTPMIDEHNLVPISRSEGAAYKNSHAADLSLNAAILRAEIARSYEEFLDIFETFYAEDVEVSREDLQEIKFGCRPRLTSAKASKRLSRMTMTHRPYHFVAIVGGAIAGSVAAEILADNGIHVVVIEQNKKPYGKIEDGLPRWHLEQRKQEYSRIDARLRKPGVFLLPSTRLGRDLDFQDLF